MAIYLLRHGETIWNRARRLSFQGQRDTPLTLRGARQAAAMGRTLAGLLAGGEPGAFLSSPLGRARQTASIVADEIGFDPDMIVLEDLVIETSFGVWDGLNMEEILARHEATWNRRRADRWHPARAVLRGLAHLCPDLEGVELVHGSTVATNALLERTGARTALVTTRGFEDVLEIGRQTRPHLYDPFVEKLPPLVPRRLRFGVAERLAYDGEVLEPLAAAEIDRVVEQVRRSGAQSLAVCLLHAYANPAHEAAIAEAAQRLGVPVSASHRILPEFREYERCSTTVVNAYLRPVMEHYLSEPVPVPPGRQAARGCARTAVSCRQNVRTRRPFTRCCQDRRAVSWGRFAAPARSAIPASSPSIWAARPRMSRCARSSRARRPKRSLQAVR